MDGAVRSVLSDPGRLRALETTGLLEGAANEVLDRLTRRVQACLRAPVSLVSLVTDDRQVFAAQQGLAEPWRSVGATPLSHSFCQYVVAEDAPLVVDDAREAPLVRDNLAVSDLGVIAYLGVPIRAPGGHTLGALCAIATEPRPWSDDDLDVLQELAETAAAEVAARHRVGEAVRSMQDARGREAALFRALFARTPGPAYVVDGQGAVTDANPAALVGRHRSDVVGRPLAAVAPGAVDGLWEVAGTNVSLALERPPAQA